MGRAVLLIDYRLLGGKASVLVTDESLDIQHMLNISKHAENLPQITCFQVIVRLSKVDFLTPITGKLGEAQTYPKSHSS